MGYLKVMLRALGMLPFCKAVWEILTYGMPAKRRHRRAMAAFYSQFVAPESLCFDVGANDGNRTAVFLNLGARVIAVEPQGDCARRLLRRYAGDARVVLVQQALGEAAGFGEMMIGSTKTLSSLSREWVSKVRESGRFPGSDWKEVSTVPITTLDKLIETYGNPSFCKIDVEGYEFQVLKGLSRPIAALSFEFTPEILTPTLEAIRHLCALGEYRFNFSVGESMVLSLPEWVSGARIEVNLKELPDKHVFGDVYARLRG